MTTRTRKISILDMDSQGKVTERKELPGSELWLDNTVAGRLYPNLKLALITVPTEILEWHETSQVAEGLFKVTFNGVNYRLVGSGGGAKNGKFYFADEEHATKLHNRFQNWPEALISYFGIQTSDCKRIAEANGTVLIVPDNELGTNDCRGWISVSMFALLDAPKKSFYQFRLGFAFENGKGSFKVMSDAVSKAVGADIIIPESSCKPAPKNLKAWSYENRTDRMFTGPLVVGLREISRDLVFGSSYTVAQFASEEVILTEIVPKARVALQSLKDAWDTKNHIHLVQQIGKKVTLDEFSQDGDESNEMRTVEAALLADGSGEICRHPYIYRQVDKLLARWAYKLLTGGGLHLPGFALADDGYLFLAEDDCVISGSDWIPRDRSFTSLASDRSLCVRYPVRMKEDLLPMMHCHRDEAIALLVAGGLTNEEAAYVADEQLFLTGTYTLHSQTAKLNGGDYDFDQICVVDEALYPKFVEDRFSFKSTFRSTKNKVGRLKSPLYSLEFVALKSMGNQIGVITDTMSSCIAAGKEYQMYLLVDELQKEIDSLKHNTRADLSVIKEIKALVGKAPWLAFKEVQRVQDLVHLDVLPTDKIGMMYNMLRHDMGEMMAAPMELRQFQGLIVGNNPTREMLEEARVVFHSFTAGFALLGKVVESKKKAVEAAVALFASAKDSEQQELIRNARKAVSKARAELKMAEESNKQSSARLIGIIAGWGKGKTESRKDWMQALHTVISSGRGTGSILFHAFPQEVIDAIAARTGGIRVAVAPHKVAGITYVKDNVFYMSTFNGSNATPLFQYDAEKRRLVQPPTAA
jgi:hypothetical protein